MQLWEFDIRFLLKYQPLIYCRLANWKELIQDSEILARNIRAEGCLADEDEVQFAMIDAVIEQREIEHTELG